MRFLCVLGVLLFVASAHANDLSSLYDEADTDARLFNNNTSLSVSFASLITGIFVLIALGILAALLSYFLFDSSADTGYSSYSSYAGNTGYASGRLNMQPVATLSSMARHMVSSVSPAESPQNSRLLSLQTSNSISSTSLDAPSLLLVFGSVFVAIFLFPIIYTYFLSKIGALAKILTPSHSYYARSDALGAESHLYNQPRSASPYASVFDKLSVLDWIAMMEEVYRKFDATSVDCQKRLVCELHQNESTWGSTARKMNDAFSYLQYFELLNLPEDLRMMLEQYLEAANKGRTGQTSCTDLFPVCEFSMKTLIEKYNGSNSL